MRDCAACQQSEHKLSAIKSCTVCVLRHCSLRLTSVGGPCLNMMYAVHPHLAISCSCKLTWLQIPNLLLTPDRFQTCSPHLEHKSADIEHSALFVSIGTADGIQHAQNLLQHRISAAKPKTQVARSCVKDA